MATEPRSSKQLAADQAAWEAGKQAREHQIRELDIALDALGPKVEKARTLLEETKAEVATYDRLKQARIAETDELKRVRQQAREELEAVQSDLATLEDIATRKRAEVDADMESYGRRKRAEYDLVLADVTELISQAQTRFNDVKTAVADAQTILDNTRLAAITERTAAEAELARVAQKTQDLEARHPELEGKIEVLTTELKRVSVERDEAVATRNKAKIEHDNFLKYELRARDILDTKDRELQQKADNLNTDERRLKAKRSFLAELN